MSKAASSLFHSRARLIAIGLLLAINMVNYIDRSMLAAVVTDVRSEFFNPETGNGNAWLAWHDSPDMWIGLLPSAFLVTYMLVSPLFGLMAERVSRWKIIGLGVILWSLASGASGLATTFGLLLLTRMLVGVGEAAYGPAAPAIISDLVEIEHRGTVMAWFYMAIPVGSALGYVLGGLAVGHATWHVAFYLSVPPGILLGIWALLMRDRRQTSTSPPIQLRWSDFRAFFAIPSFLWNTLGLTFMTFALGGLAYWMNDYVWDYRLQRSETVTKETVAYWVGLTAVLSGLTGTLIGGVVCDRLRKRFRGAYLLVSGITMLIGLPLFLLVLWDDFPRAWAWLFLAEFAIFFGTGATNTALANVIAPNRRAAAFGINILVIHLFGDVISPPLVGQVNHLTGSYDLAMGLVSLAMLASGFCWILGARTLDADTARIEQGLD